MQTLRNVLHAIIDQYSALSARDPRVTTTHIWPTQILIRFVTLTCDFFDRKAENRDTDLTYLTQCREDVQLLLMTSRVLAANTVCGCVLLLWFLSFLPLVLCISWCFCFRHLCGSYRSCRSAVRRQNVTNVAGPSPYLSMHWMMLPNHIVFGLPLFRFSDNVPWRNCKWVLNKCEHGSWLVRAIGAAVNYAVIQWQR